MAETRFGTYELLAASEPAMRPTAVRLREIAFATDPDAVEVVRLGDHAATYGVGPRKMVEGYCYVLPYAKWVNLGFFQGVALPDPDGSLEGTDARMRQVKVRSVEQAEAPALKRLIEASVEERRMALARS